MVVNSRWSTQSYKFAAGNLFIISSEKSVKRQRRDLQADDAPLLIESATEYETRIQYTPELTPSASSRQGFEAIIRQFVDSRGVFSSVPTLMVKNIVPRGSHIFTLVEEGRLSEFKEMLYLGKASIRDQDEEGASLLHVRRIKVFISLKVSSLTICSMHGNNQTCVAFFLTMEQT